ncbi:hypothetical protein CFIMG_008286RA00001 [Ceratocystis fimbriata CBS 114723]|uniref:Uncharacterized protein n=1 Tax=Ceratocystis fimbriata CBS 114723 TaxID=1035309 RepID=A0A2C5X4Q2_9PEZI|nr:hypothetical protein CFIMG_008286RA00001 [Ceratocystis fimbriata CBS 114723]
MENHESVPNPGPALEPQTLHNAALPRSQSSSSSTEHNASVSSDLQHRDGVSGVARNIGDVAASKTERAGNSSNDTVNDPDIELSRSITTHKTASSAVAPAVLVSEAGSQTKKSWFKNLNPLKMGAAPPVPESRSPSPESSANWLSLLMFHWMTPLMTASTQM